MQQTIAITGATGKVGKAVAEQLLQSNIKVRAVARSADKLIQLKKKGAEIFIGNLEDKSFVSEALRGASAVFVMVPPCYHLPNFHEVHNRIAENLTESIKAAAISHAVLLSSVGADLPSGNGQIALLYKFESMLKTLRELSVIALRSAFFMENHLGSIPLIKNLGMMGSIIDENFAFGMIATKDIAATAANYLLKPAFSGFNVQYLLGPRDYTFREAASIIGAAIGKPDLAYVKFPYNDFIQGLIGAGFSREAADALFEGFTALNNGRFTKNVIRNSSNTTPTTFHWFVEEIFVPAYNQDKMNRQLS